MNGGTLSSFLLHFKAIFDGEELPSSEIVMPNADASQPDASSKSLPDVNEEATDQGNTRNRNSRIYAEASEQMLGMGDRKLDRELDGSN